MRNFLWTALILSLLVASCGQVIQHKIPTTSEFAQLGEPEPSQADIAKSAVVHDAVESGDIEKIKHLLNQPDYVGWMEPLALWYAASSGQLEIARFLLDRGIDSNARDSFSGETALHRAVFGEGAAAMASLLLSREAEIDARDNDGRTPLHRAANYGSKEVVKFLIDKGAEVNAKDVAGYTPLDLVAIRNNIVYELLCENGGESGEPLRAELWHAINEEDVATVKELLAKGANPDARADDGSTPLHQAAGWHGEVEMAALLISSGANLNLKANNGRTPLHEAVALNNCEVAQLLIASGADVNATDDGETPLHLAARYRGEELVQALILKGAEINPEDDNGFTPLDYTYRRKEIANLLKKHGARSGEPLRDSLIEAVSEGNLAKVEELVARGANLKTRDPDDLTLLHYAGSAKVARFLISKGANVNAVNDEAETPLHFASTGEIAKVLITNGAAVNAMDEYNGYTPLHCATAEGRKDVVEQLIAAAADVNVTDKYAGYTPLHHAASDGHKDIVEQLVAGGAVIDYRSKPKRAAAVSISFSGPSISSGVTALHLASCEGHQSIVQLLVGKGASISASDDGGATPLHAAVEGGHKEVAAFLISKGASVNAKDSDGLTPLHWAVCCGQTAMLGFLVAQGADVNSEDKDGQTPLHKAAIEEWDEDAARLLIANGAQVSATDKDGRTPLHNAAEYWDEDAARFLIANGAQVNAVDKDGKTPLDMAQGSDLLGGEDVAELLRKHGGKTGKELKEGKK